MSFEAAFHLVRGHLQMKFIVRPVPQHCLYLATLATMALVVFLHVMDNKILYSYAKLILHFSPTIELPSPMRRVVDRPGAAPVPQRVPP